MKNDNDLFYTCSLIEFIGRKQKLKRSDVVSSLGEKTLLEVYSSWIDGAISNLRCLIVEQRRFFRENSVKIHASLYSFSVSNTESHA